MANQNNNTARASAQSTSEAIEKAISECGVQAISQLPAFLQAVKMAEGISALRRALTDEFMMSVVMPLQGCALGFRTDRDDKEPRGYPLQVVRDVVIEAMLRGFSIIGNELNIIGGRFYGTKEGLERRVLEYPGLRNLKLEPGVPTLQQGGALVPYSAFWMLGTEQMALHCHATKEGDMVIDNRLPVRVNAGMGADAVLGKAERKMYHRILKRLTGANFGLVDGEVEDARTLLTTAEPAPLPVPEGTPEGRRVKLPQGGKRGPVVVASEPSNDGAAAAQLDYGNILLPEQP